MKIVITTTPIRPVPTEYPPFGSMAIIRSMREAGYDPYFYDIDGLRPPFEEVEKFFREYQPDVVGISAVVSTAYGYTKMLARMLKRVAPKVKIILGGNLAASAEILHRLAGIDVCVIGEGEIVSVNLLRAFEKSPDKIDPEALLGIRGLTFLRKDGEMAFTGYEAPLPSDQVFNPDFSILERFSNLKNFVASPLWRHDFSRDPRTHQPHRKGKTMTTLVTEKGCVARCTFCHRWDKGFRAIPVAQIVDTIKLLQKRYNVGFIAFSDENFGSDKKQTQELIARLKELDVLWQVAGVRVKSVNPGLLAQMKDSGCVAVYYGMETGSPRIIEIMEKKATIENNLDAAKWMREAGLPTIFMMVLAMPGENEQTIKETTEFLKLCTQDRIEPPRSIMSINYIQGLPGTPVYEYARLKGLIGKALRDEEAYLLSISDINAADDTKVLNFTEYDYLTLRSWRRRIVLEVMRHYYEHNKVQVPSFFSFVRGAATRRLFKKKAVKDNVVDQGIRTDAAIEDYAKGGYFNLSRDLGYDVIVAYFYPFRNVILSLWLLQDEFKRLPFKEFVGHIWDWAKNRIRKPLEAIPTESLRKTVADLAPPALTVTERAMQPLRDGR